MGIFVEANLKIFGPWLKECNASFFHICFASPPSTSKKKIMIRIDKLKFFTLAEIEEKIGETVFTVTESKPENKKL